MSHHPDWLVFEGGLFRRARFWFPRFGLGVVCQYREHCPEFSRHLYVYCDGSMRVDHIDRWNPDFGHLARHFFADVMPDPEKR